MAIRIVQLGSPRKPGEGLRVGTVRRPPRGVPKTEYAARDFYDVWLPELAPSEALVKLALRATDDRAWRSFVTRYRAEMKAPPAARLLDLLAALSPHTSLSVGCYCADPARCHRSVLHALLVERGARVVEERVGHRPPPPARPIKPVRAANQAGSAARSGRIVDR